MLEEGTRWGYVLAAYGVTALIMGALAWFSVAQGARARRELERLEARRRGEDA